MSDDYISQADTRKKKKRLSHLYFSKDFFLQRQAKEVIFSHKNATFAW